MKKLIKIIEKELKEKDDLQRAYKLLSIEIKALRLQNKKYLEEIIRLQKI